MIQNLLFDFGGVFLELDKQATQNHLKNYFPKGIPADIQTLHLEYEKGAISTDDFIHDHLKLFSGLNQSGFIQIWNSMLGELPEHRIEFLESLKNTGKYQILLLSNTNELHINWVKENITSFDRFKSCFDQFYLSYEIGYRKPNADIFEFVLKNSQIKPEETLFIDDTLEHIQTAKKLGFNVWHLNENQHDITELFEINHSIL